MRFAYRWRRPSHSGPFGRPLRLLGLMACAGGAAMGATVRLPAACAAPHDANAPALFVERAPRAGADSLVTIRLCIAPSHTAVGSYHARINYDTSIVTFARALASTNGMQALNPQVAGVIEIAGAAPSGFASGTLATVVLRPRKSGAIGKLRLTLIEMNATTGSDLRATIRIAGYPAADKTLGALGSATTPAARDSSHGGATATETPLHSPNAKKSLTWAAVVAPHIDSLRPDSARLGRGSVVEVSIHGAGFTSAGNLVLFGRAELGPVASTDGATIRFVVPTVIPTGGEVAPMRTGPGDYPVSVRNANGQSNSVMFRVGGQPK